MDMFGVQAISAQFEKVAYRHNFSVLTIYLNH